MVNTWIIAILRLSAPILLCAVGSLFCDRAGVTNISLEGTMLLAAFMGVFGSYLGLALVYSAMFMPFIVFLYTGFMRSLPMEIMESARIDGCSYFQAYVHIYMPLLKTITGIVLVLRGVYVWNDLQVPLIVINDPAKQTLQQRLYVFAQSRIGNFDLVFAGALIVCLPMVILFLLMQKSFIKGVMAGSIKG